ncbi:MAG: Gfo/Idh/MocA family oxidoreductase [Rhodospirillales bacterium]|nr:Gfo/Idh/MocA family oxidoreductase [Rhodospirillales bacterium]
MKTLGVGIVGCGNISTIYMQNMPNFAGVRLLACADMRPEAAQAQAAKFGIDALSIDALLKRADIDIVVNLTTPNAHFEVGSAALAAGKHVFGEKPICVEAAHAQTLVAEAAKRGLKIGCAPDTFLGAGGRLAREILDSGKVGRILAGSCFLMSHGMEHWHPDPEFFFKPGGGPILDMAPYYLGALVNLLGPVAQVTARTSSGFAERLVTSEGPRKGHRITVETPTTAMAIVSFAGGADIVFTMSWDVWKHGHPPIELYGTEGSMRVPDPNFFGGTVEYTERGGDWIVVDSASKPFGKPNWRSPNWAPTLPNRANYRCLGIAELASAAARGTPHRASGALASHVLDAMHAILESGRTGAPVAVASRIDRPASLTDAEAAALWTGPKQ